MYKFDTLNTPQLGSKLQANEVQHDRFKAMCERLEHDTYINDAARIRRYRSPREVIVLFSMSLTALTPCLCSTVHRFTTLLL